MNEVFEDTKIGAVQNKEEEEAENQTAIFQILQDMMDKASTKIKIMTVTIQITSGFFENFRIKIPSTHIKGYAAVKERLLDRF